MHYAVGDLISFSGHATDLQDGIEPDSQLHWQAILHHCYNPDSCHTHFIEGWDGVASGSFIAPDHEYPSYVELQLTANDSSGASATTSVRLDPQTVPVTFTSNPSGMLTQVGSASGVTPFTTTMVANASDTVSALSPQAVGATTYTFSSWSDGGSQTHIISAPTTATTFTATYAPGGTLPDLTGSVNDSLGRPVAGATVTLTPDGRSVTTDGSGHYTITGVNAGNYTVTASLTTTVCASSASAPVTMSGAQNVTLTLTQKADAFGNTCADTINPSSYIAANTVTGITGDDVEGTISTPFPIRYYGSTYSTAWVDTNGTIAFLNPGGSAEAFGTHMPNAAAPNAMIAPFWADLVVDASASIRTQSVGTAPNRQFVVEWRNATFYVNRNQRITVEAIFTENTGGVTLVYKDIDANALEQGSVAVVGMENATGTDGFEYAYQGGLVRTGLTVTFLPPNSAPLPTGSVSGTLTRASDGTPVSGATVTLSVLGATTTTAANGSYQFAGVPYGSYTVSALLGSGLCGGLSATGTVSAQRAATLDLSATQRADTFGYTCTTGGSAYVAGTTSLGLTGDDVIKQITPPFPIRYYGATYSTAWVDTNGVIELVNPGSSVANFGVHIPNTGPPNGTIFAFLDDLMVDSQASTYGDHRHGAQPHLPGRVAQREVLPGLQPAHYRGAVLRGDR